MSEKPLAEALALGLAELGLTLSQHQQKQLLEYLAEFHKWNRAYNLSAVRDPQAMLYRHLLDSLSILPQVSAQAARRLIDVGTGGGLPGLPLAIALPDTQVTLLDSNGKKTRFLFHVKTRLGLDNVTVINDRSQAHRPEPGYDLVISRAFASLADMVAACAHLVTEDGVILAMKGVYPEEELAEVAGQADLVASHSLQVPGNEGERHLLELSLR